MLRSSLGSTSRNIAVLALMLSLLVLLFLAFTLSSSTYKRIPVYENESRINRIGFGNLVDYTRLINITQFEFLAIPIICSSEERLLVLVHSAPNNLEKRTTIRETWGNVANGIIVLFMLGITENQLLGKDLTKEIQHHQDIVQGSFLDTYKNLTYKHMMALKYAIYHCPTADYILKVDDDTFVNTPDLLRFLEVYSQRYPQRRNILCRTITKNPVLRKGKWAVSKAEYDGEEYPTHCSGYAIIYHRDAILPLYIQGQRTKYFWIDDVHVSGTLAQGARVEQIDIGELVLYKGYVNWTLVSANLKNERIRINDLSFGNISTKFLLSGVNLSKKQITDLWTLVKNLE